MWSAAGKKVKNRDAPDKIGNVGMRHTMLFTFEEAVTQKYVWRTELTPAFLTQISCVGSVTLREWI